jgi:hypothetical protein
MQDITSQVAAKLVDLGFQDVATFQRANGLSPDGVAGHDTLVAMGLGSLFQLALGADQTQLDVKNTPLSVQEAAQALCDGYAAVASQKPASAVLGLLMAQSALETAQWQRLPNYNFGGIKATSGAPFVQAFITPEGAGAAQKLYVLGFAAYQSAVDGAAAYVRVLHARAAWWAGLQTGDAVAYVASLVSIPGAHYFTGDPAAYLASVKAGQKRFDVAVGTVLADA